MIEALSVLAVPEDNRQADQQLLAVLLGLDDPVVRNALQGQVLAVRGALGGLALVLCRRSLGQVDADNPAGLVVRQARVAGEVVLQVGPASNDFGSSS
jgi:hypothetical protein